MIIRLCQDAVEWNHAVLMMKGTLYHSWQWGELRRSNGWLPWRVLVENQGLPRAAMQLLERRLPIAGASILWGIRGIADHGLQFDGLLELVKWLRAIARERRSILIRLDPGFAESEELRLKELVQVGFHSLPDRWSLWNLPRAVMTLDITRSTEEVFDRMHHKVRQNIRGFEKRWLECEVGTERAHIRDFYSVFLGTGERRGFPVRDLDHFLRVRDLLLANNGGSVFLARHQRDVVAGLLCAKFGKICYALYGGSDFRFGNLKAQEVLYWKAILWAKESGCEVFDLLGAMTDFPVKPRNPGYGIYLFKTRLGAGLHIMASYLDLFDRKLPYDIFRFFETRAGGPAFRAFVKARSIGKRFTLATRKL
jgi:lipid II:glycine glycyltransferase (peptidoglycan interpeptide bridge formation enzyme)